MPYRLSEDQIRKVINRGSVFLCEYCQENNIHYIVTGSSGGLDSAVTLGFAQRACQIAKEKGFNLTSVALIMPCESEPKDAVLGRKAAEKFGAEIVEIDLTAFFDFLHPELGLLDGQIIDILKRSGGEFAIKQWPWSKRVAQGNIKARLRMIAAYHTARLLKGMVLSTDNLSEHWMAFWTICGDVGDFNVIQNIMKGLELYDIARCLEVPEEILSSKPGDGLKVAGSAADQLGAEYPAVDKIMVSLIQNGFQPNGSMEQLEALREIPGFEDELVARIARRCLEGSYKRLGTMTLSREALNLPRLEKIVL